MRKAFLCVLLIGVFLNLADWPYLDEIFADIPHHAGLVVVDGVQAVPDVPASDDPVHLGYQLLLAMQAVPALDWTLPPLERATESPGFHPIFVAALPIESIDRPPAPAS